MTRGEVINLFVYQRIVTDFEVMQKFNAVGLSESILLNLKQKGVHLIRIVRISPKFPTKIYYSVVDAFLNSNLKYEYIKDDINKFVPFSQMMLQTRDTQKTLIQNEKEKTL